MNFIKKLICIINMLYLGVFIKRENLGKSDFFLVKILGNLRDNKFNFLNSLVEKTDFTIFGKLNEINCSSALISDCSINIDGYNNKIILKEGVKLRNSKIQLRGDNLFIEIDENTTFGGVRIVNVGSYNQILIGKNCLFSDHIEIWASDTHSIFNSEGEKINKEKPIIIRNNVWVGSQVIILKGVELGEGSIVGMGSVVAKSTNPKSINVGNPNKEIKSGISWDLKY